MSQQAKTPFYIGAKLRYVDDKLNNAGKFAPFQSESSSSIQLRKVGLLCAVIMRVEVDVALGAGTPVVNEEGGYGLIKRLQCIIGNQQAQPLDLSASGLKHIQRLAGHLGFGGYDTPSMGRVVPNPMLWNMPIVAGQTNKWVFTYLIPFSANLHKDRHIGFLPTSARGFSANLQIDWAKTSEIISGVTADFSNSKISLQTIVLDTPDYTKIEQPSFWVLSRKSVREGGVLAGENAVEIPQGGRILSLGGVLRVNNQRANDIDNVGIRLAGNNEPLNQRLWENHADFKRKTNLDLNTGEWCYNFMDSFNEQFSGLPRDTVDTGRVGLTEMLVNVNSENLSVNASANTIETIRTTMHAIAVSTETETGE